MKALTPYEAPAGLSERTRKKLLVPVALSAEPAGPRVLMANFAELERLGVKVPANHRLTAEFERELLTRFALRSDAEGAPTVATGFATRYQGYPGAVQGDGRAVIVAQATRHDREQRPRERVDIQVKGIATGLIPRREDWASRHGKMFLSRAIQEALYADYLDVNGVSSNRWLLVIDSGAVIIRPSDGGEVRVGLHVRVGHFWRMGHLWKFGDDRRTLNELIRMVTAQLAAERGRKTPVSLRRAFLLLLQRKAIELADSWWLRYAHGSFTPDNIGLFECIDQGTACTVDRTHVSFSAHKMGYGHCPELLMEEDYKRHLPDLLLRVADRKERVGLRSLAPAQLARGWLEARMTLQALRHLGFDEREVRFLLGHHRGQALEHYRLVRRLADAVMRDFPVLVGVRLAFKAHHAARYDVFSALTKVIALRAHAKWTARERAQRLLAVLRPEEDRSGFDLQNALQLVESVDGLAALLLGRHAAPEHAGRLAMWRERARALNRRVRPLEGGDSLDLADELVRDRIDGASVDRIRARLAAILRRDVVDGPGTALEAARRLRSAHPTRLPDGRLVVASCSENGVRLEQVSDGVRDVVRFTVTGNPLKLADPSALRLELRWGPVRLLRGGVGAEGDEVVFEVELPARVPLYCRAFFSAVGAKHRFTNGGIGFGKHVRLVFRSLEVQLALAVEAQRRGLQRALPPVLSGKDAGERELARRGLLEPRPGDDVARGRDGQPSRPTRAVGNSKVEEGEAAAAKRRVERS